MRYITIPESIKVKEQPIPVTFLNLIEQWTNDNKFGALGVAGIKMSIAIHDRFRDAKIGDEIPLDDKEWTQLCEIVNNPTGGYVTSVVKQVMAFCDAVINAPNKKSISVNGAAAQATD